MSNKVSELCLIPLHPFGLRRYPTELCTKFPISWSGILLLGHSDFQFCGRQ
jgi:hypothetical protein